MAGGEENWFAPLTRELAPEGTLVRTWPLTGGVSARLTALELEHHDGRRERVVVREHGAGDLERNPNVAADEFRLLQLLHSAGLPTPRPLHLDATGELLPTPFIVIEYVEGATPAAPRDLASYLSQLANVLVAIHDCSLIDRSFLPRRDVPRPASPRPESAIAEEARVREVLERASLLPERSEPVLLHGDFWPGNTLWSGGRLVAVLDWEDAAVGDPLADLGNARLELLWASGAEAMDRFTRLYAGERRVDLAQLPAWDLFAALRLGPQVSRWGLDPSTEETMRDKLRAFTEEALTRLCS